MSNPILDQVYGAAGAASASINNALFAVSAGGAEAADIDNQNVQLNLDLGKNEQLVQDVANQGKLAAESDKTAFALSIGADIGDTSGTQAKLAAKYNQATTDQAAALEEVNQKKGVSPFEDPIGWFSAQFSLPASINKYNAATSTKNQAEESIEAINKMASQRAQTDAALQVTSNVASMKASSEEIAEKAQLNANQSRLAAITANTSTAEKLASLSSQQLGVIANTLSATDAQESLQIQREHLAIAEASEQERVKNLQDKQAGYDQIANDVKTGLSVLYPNNPNAQAQIGSPAIIAQIRGSVPMDPVTKQAYEVGVMNRVSGSDSRLLAHTPYDMLGTLNIKPDLSPAQRQTAQMLIDAKTELETNKGGSFQGAFNAALASKDKQGIESAYNAYAQSKLDTLALHVDGPSNPYYLPSIDKIATQVPNLQQLSLYQKVIAPAIAAKIDLSDPNQVVKLTTDAIANGTIKMNKAAADLATLYGIGALQGSQARSLAAMGLNPSHSYNVKIQDPGSFSSNIYDLTNSTQVLAALGRQMAKTAANTIFEAGVALP